MSKVVVERGANGWGLLEYLGIKDLSICYENGIYVTLPYGDRQAPTWRVCAVVGQPYLAAVKPIIDHCELLAQLNPSVDTMIRALAVYLPTLEPYERR